MCCAHFPAEKQEVHGCNIVQKSQIEDSSQDSLLNLHNGLTPEVIVGCQKNLKHILRFTYALSKM